MQSDKIREVFFQGNSMDTILHERGEGDTLWNNIVSNLPYIPVAYTRSSLDYQATYMGAFLDDLIDCSIIIRHAGEPVGIWPLSLRFKNGSYEFATNEGGVLPPVYVKGLSSRLIRKYDKSCVKMIQDFYKTASNDISLSGNWGSRVSFLPGALQEQNIIWEQICMELDGRASVVHDLYVDLSLPIDEIHRALRKSYQSLLNEGERLWKIDVLDHVSHEDFDEYRLLHQAVAGRVTRPLGTWDLQRESINSGDGFLVTLRDDSGRMIGGGLFSLSMHEGLYAVGAYDRSLFDKPVSHVVQWTAIKHLKELGRRWHYVGQRFYPGDMRTPTEKELSIAYFKEGFATHMFLRLTITNAPQ